MDPRNAEVDDGTGINAGINVLRTIAQKRAQRNGVHNPSLMSSGTPRRSVAGLKWVAVNTSGPR
ncbi:hypothetical protein MOKP76_15640 [Mycobacterium avium subsp. hominissuis]